MRLRRPSKRLTIALIVGLVCVLGAGAYTWQSLREWRGYEARLQGEQREYDDLKKAALGGKTPEVRLTAIRSLDDKVSGRAELCHMNGLYAWQATIIPPLKDGVARCNQKVKQLNLIAGPLHELRQYLDAGAKLQATISSLVQSESLNESNWSDKGLARAQTAQTDIKALKLTGDAAQLQSQAKSLADNLVKAWEALIKANGDKDKAAYIAAAASVTKSYADFAGLADTADTAIQTKVDALIKAAT